MAFKHFELYFLSIIRNERKGFFAALLRSILFGLSYPFQLGVMFRNWLFDQGWKRSYIPPVPLVISIGNITTGGTGKTPVTLMIAEELAKVAPLAILSRGYRSQAEKFASPVVLNKSKGLIHPASFCGDEPYLLADNLPDVHVIVGKNRYLSSKAAARLGALVLLLDDGMQHRGIARDLEIVVMDLLDPFGQGYFLPRGLLREGKGALGRADLIILNHANDLDRFEFIRRQISQYSSAPVVGTEVEVVGLFDLEGKPVPITPNMSVGVFCGIAHPEYFKKTVQNMGLEVVREISFIDHDAMDLDRLMAFSMECVEAGASLLLCTEKDKVKLVNQGSLQLPIAWVKTRLKSVKGEEHLAVFLDRAKITLRDKK